MAGSFWRLFQSWSRLTASSGVLPFPRCEITEPRQAKKQIQYSFAQLRSLRYSSKRVPIDLYTHQSLKEHGILKPFRGCRSGMAVKSAEQSSSLNIRTCKKIRKICITDQSRSRSRNLIQLRTRSRNLVQLRHAPAAKQPNKEFGPAIALANMMSLCPKMDELRCFVDNKKPDLVSLTET